MAPQETLERRGRRLEYGTTVWNSLEAAVAIFTGLTSHSLALVAFGLDSCVEVLASVVVLWHLGGEPEAVDPRRAQRAMRLIAAAFAVLGAYLVGDTIHGLITRQVSQPSDIGTAFMAATVSVMLALAWGKRHTGLALENRPLIANASMTLIDGCLAAGILVALGTQRFFRWWWTDPLAAAVVAVIALNEARQNWTSSGPGVDATGLPGRD
jgi:divalent metal cation (Fe/Co/Zn/Cd) transporter